MEGFSFKNLKNLLPLGTILPFVFIIIFEVILLYVLDFYIQKLQKDIANLEAEINNKTQSLGKSLEVEESFYVFSQLVNVVEIVKKKVPLRLVIEKFLSLMPKFLVIKNFSYNAEKKEISFNASVDSWYNYLRLVDYFKNVPEFEAKFTASPNFDGQAVNFSLILLLKPDFYKEK